MQYGLLAGACGLALMAASAGPPSEPGAPTATAPAAGRLSLPPAETTHIDEAHLARAQKLINGGITAILKLREPDGGWSLGRERNKPAITALALKVLLQHPDFTSRSPQVQRGFEVMLGFRQKDGGIYNPPEGMANYSTSVAIMAMVSAQDPRFADEIRDAVAYLKASQIVPGSESPDGGKIAADHAFVGGVSYGRDQRPDLSNQGMWMQALHDAGVSSSDPHMQRALQFVLRLQNRSESNAAAWAKQGANDGGFVYAVGESKAGQGPGGRGLRSYGSITYIGFKSMLYAGLAKDDPRVAAAYDWLRKYWRLDSNPNMPQAASMHGLYYYYHVLAKALRAWGEPIITDVKGVKHNWRHELIDALAERVRPDGSWVNEADRWYEGYPALVTCYGVLALQEALKK